MKRTSFLAIALILPTLILADKAGDRIELRMAHGTFDPRGTAPAPPGWLRAETVTTSPRGLQYRVVVTTGPLEELQRRRLETAGVEILGYLPVHGYRVRLDPRRQSEVRSLPFVSWLGPLPDQYKIAPQLLVGPGEPSRAIALRVIVAAGEPTTRVEAALQGLNRSAAPSGPTGAWRIRADVPGNRFGTVLSRLAALPEVEAIERAHAVVPLNQDAVWVHQSNVGPANEETPLYDHGLFGCDQVVAVADTGQDYGSCYFDDTARGTPPISSCVSPPCPVATPDSLQRKNLLYYNWSPTATGDDDTCPTTLFAGSGHGTHISGSVAGDASPYADCTTFATDPRSPGDGQAPGARLVFQELGDGFEYLNDLGGTVWNIVDVAYQSGARIHNISWGGVCYDLLGQCVAGCDLTYDSFARDTDLAMWTYPELLMVQGAGNGAGICPAPNAIVTPALAKSSLTVASVGHDVNAGSASSFSSPGPTFDGRLKPTVAAQGESVVSAASDSNGGSNNCTICSLSGTSMASPTAAGLAALVREYYTAGFHVAGVRDPAQGFTPSGALIKATLIDGAVPLDVASAPAPDFTTGFGRLLLGSTLPFVGSPFDLWVEDHRQGLTTGGVATHAFDVGGGEPFRATLVWSDYPADLNAAVARVNELKLEVIDPSGNVWFQSLHPTSGLPQMTSDPGAAHDPINVEERLVFAAPTPGRWVVRVRGIDVAWGPQPFALVVRGSLSECAAPNAPAAPVLTTPADQQVEISWNAVVGAPAYNVYRSLGDCPGGPWVPVATGLTGTTFLDSSVSGGATYSYYVAATSDAEAFCESANSACSSVAPTGACFLDPDFRGIAAASSPGSVDRSVTLAWDPATPICGADVRYNIYRGSSSGFVPDASNRIASCVDALSYSDTVGLLSGAEYHYIVRAEDAANGGGGPCRDGNEDGNLSELAARPLGPPQFGMWTDDAGDTGEAKFQLGPAWTIDELGGDSGPGVYRGASSTLICTDLTSPVITLAPASQGPQLSFTTIHDLDYDPGFILNFEGSVGQVEIALGPDFNNWTRVSLNPDYPAYVDAVGAIICPTTPAFQNYFSDIDLSYDTYSASLTNWAGSDVKLRFHLSGDLYFSGGNWWIDDVAVTQAEVPGSCNSSATGPPPIPDGASVAGTPLLVAKSGTDLQLTWDAAGCPAASVNVYHGNIGDYATFAGGQCGLPATGSATMVMPDNVWFLVVATDGAATDGSWSRDRSGNELTYGGATAVCPTIQQHVTNGSCP